MKMMIKNRYLRFAGVCIVNMICLMYASCTGEPEKAEADGGITATRYFKFTLQGASGTALTDINGYLFRKGIFQKAYRNVTAGSDGRTSLNVPANSELYFLAGIPEPSQLGGMQEGVTTRETFLSYHTPVDDAHTSTSAPTLFYSGRCMPDIAGSDFIIPMQGSRARVDLDVTEADGVTISHIYTRSAAQTTSYFSDGVLSHPEENCGYSRTFSPAESGRVENVFSMYESDSPVTFFIEGIYGDAPIAISTPVAQVKRNKIYRIRIQSMGMNVVGNIIAEDWKTGDEITATEDENGSIKVSRQYSYLPGSSLDKTGSVVTIPYSGATGLILAFLTEEPLRLESIEGIVDINAPEVSDADGKVLTKYTCNFPENNTQLMPCATLNLKSTLNGQTVRGKITLNIASYPYKMPEVVMGGLTWMAFNSTSGKVTDQIYPEFYGYDTVQEVYDRQFMDVMGKLFRYDHLKPYDPWKPGDTPWQQEAGEGDRELPWSDTANVPCPNGYRLPTPMEMKGLMNAYWEEMLAGPIPGSWTFNGDKITGRIVLMQDIQLDKPYKLKFLELTNQKGVVLYFPFGAMKSNGNTAQYPDFGSSLVLWTSESSGNVKAYALKLLYETPYTIANAGEELDKGDLAYVRCVKKTY